MINRGFGLFAMLLVVLAVAGLSYEQMGRNRAPPTRSELESLSMSTGEPSTLIVPGLETQP